MKYIINILIIVFIITITSCNKTDFLDKKPDDKLIIPQTLEELQGLLDNSSIMNGGTSGQAGVDPHLGQAASDDYYITADYLNMLTATERNIYTWNDDINSGDRLYDWDFPYRAVFYSNTVLKELSELTPTRSEEVLYNTLKGSALFYRARMFYQIAQVYAPHYETENADKDLGIPLLESTDINSKVKRASLKETYDKIIDDLLSALPLLPEKPVLVKTRPSKHAVYAMLSKVFLTMGDYDKSLEYATKTLTISKDLMDYNNETIPFKRFNTEVIFHSVFVQITSYLVNPSFISPDTTLYNSYHTDDLRKSLFFLEISPNYYYFQGTYEGSPNLLFSGIATDEILLTQAECYARKGNVQAAMDDLNYLLRSRWRKQNGIPLYIDQTANSAEEALDIILKERRKELIFRGTRWTDLRRLNSKGGNIALKRVVGTETFTLSPNDFRYTFLIPPSVITFNPTMPQNNR